MSPGRGLLLSTCLVAALAGCATSDNSPGPGPRAEREPTSRVEAALGVLPSDATAVFFLDQGTMARRLGFGDLSTGASQAELDRWIEAARGTSLSCTALCITITPMQSAAFSELDIEWEVVAERSGKRPVRVWRMRKELDFDAVAADLADAGYERSGDDEAPRFTHDRSTAIDGSYGGRYPSFLLTELALVPAEHAIVTGDLDAGIEAVLDGDAVPDKGAFQALLEAAPSTSGLEHAFLAIDPVCRPGRPYSAHAEAQVDASGIGRPDVGLALFGDPASPVTSARVFADEAGGRADASRLPAYLNTVRVAGFDDAFEIRLDGSAVVVETGWDVGTDAVNAFFASLGPFSCPADPNRDAEESDDGG